MSRIYDMDGDLNAMIEKNMREAWEKEHPDEPWEEEEDDPNEDSPFDLKKY